MRRSLSAPRVAAGGSGLARLGPRLGNMDRSSLGDPAQSNVLRSIPGAHKGRPCETQPLGGLQPSSGRPSWNREPKP